MNSLQTPPAPRPKRFRPGEVLSRGGEKYFVIEVSPTFLFNPPRVKVYPIGGGLPDGRWYPQSAFAWLDYRPAYLLFM